MDELLAKLTNLSYDFFGILLPGIILNIFALLLWAALGSLAPIWTANEIPEFEILALQHLFDILGLKGRIFAAVPLLFLWYFLGHLLHWVGRFGKRSSGQIHGGTMVCQSLLFRIPKAQYSYDPKLEPLYQAIRTKFSSPGVELEWSQFFPVVKIYLAQRLTRSLVSTYQTKYTFHRSITTASTILFWFSLLGIFGALVMLKCFAMPHWIFLIFLPIGAIILVWGFSGSYLYNWGMFGNTIITEAYSLLYGPQDDQPAKQELSSH